ncbi:MAG: SGNH/GDSL hydrolase family protein [Gemmatimonadales bacterium]|nr:SGNH/GDSL hydrolase family protein [Gemmatimonadales bacterium]
MKFLALGDSYTIGEAVSEAERWPVVLADQLARGGIRLGPPEIIAQTGWTTDELAAAIITARPVGPYDLVSLLIGVNNQYRGRPAEEFSRELRGLLQTASSLAGGESRRVIALSIPDWGVTPFADGRDRAAIASEIDRYNAIVCSEASQRNARFVDITGASRLAANREELTASDGLHPSAAMYADWVRLVLPEARAALASAGR